MDSTRVPEDGTSATEPGPVDEGGVPATMPGYRLDLASAGDGMPAAGPGSLGSIEVPATMPGYRLDLAPVEDGTPVTEPGPVGGTEMPVTMPGYRLEPAAAVAAAEPVAATATATAMAAPAAATAPARPTTGQAVGRASGRPSGSTNSTSSTASRSAQRRGQLAVRAGLVAWGVLVVGLWWFATPGSSLHGGAAVMTAFGRVSGLLAAYLMLVELLLMARIPVLERAVGLERLAAWHRGLGTNIVLLMVSHVLLTVWGYGLADHRQPVSELFTVITTYPEMWKATIGVLLFVTVGVTSARTLRPRISYEVWYFLHLAAYAAVLLVYGHQVSTGAEFVGHPVNQRLWRAMYVTVFACLVIGRLVLPLVANVRHRLRVERVVEEAPGIVSVWIRGRNVDRLGARSGQFLRWRFLAPGHWLSAHPYSLSAPPRPDRLRITVKAAGDQSRAMASLRPGTVVVVDGPFGLFTAERATRGKSLLVAGGGGIGPIRALAEELANRGKDVVVIHRVRKADDLALWSELRRIASRHRMRVQGIVGSRRELGHDPLAADALAAAVPDLIERDVFICGPTGMIHTLVRSLQTLGLAADQIHTEVFSLRDAYVGAPRDADRPDGADDAGSADGADSAKSVDSADGRPDPSDPDNSTGFPRRTRRAAPDERDRDEDVTRREVAVPSAGLQQPEAGAAT
ncbi:MULTISPECIES: ferredoxin reductase family protein [Pseudofrankia]|uniref:ferredoxin reductase family protein n=1 Tax=Pseudofrankia TaxID=2994363 RepID=UPI000234C752|nr:MULTISPECIES: ferredoxin reductase family protein [Pseudofrankia]